MIFVNKRAENIDDIVNSGNEDEVVRFWGEIIEDVMETCPDATVINIGVAKDKQQALTHRVTTDSKKGVEWAVFDY